MSTDKKSDIIAVIRIKNIEFISPKNAHIA